MVTIDPKGRICPFCGGDRWGFITGYDTVWIKMGEDLVETSKNIVCLCCRFIASICIINQNKLVDFDK